MKISSVRKSTVFAVSFGTLAVVLFGCGTAGKKLDGSDSDLVLPFEKPADSTGAQSDVVMSFGMLESSTALMLETPVASSVIVINAQIEVTDARLNIAAIKIKAAKVPSENEKAFDKKHVDKMKDRNTKEETEDKTAEEAIIKEEVAAGRMLSLAETPPEKPKAKPTKADMAKKREEHKKSAAGDRKAKDVAELEEEAKADESLKWKGPFVYDLVKKTSTPELTSLKLADGSYKRIDILLKPNRTVVDTDALLNNTLYIGGTVLLNGVKVPFKISYHKADHVRLAGSSDESAVKLEANIENKLVIAFDVKAWFTDVNLSTATLTDGAIIIDKNSNKEILKMIHKNIKKATHFGKGTASGKLKAIEAKGNGKAAVEAEAAAG